MIFELIDHFESSLGILSMDASMVAEGPSDVVREELMHGHAFSKSSDVNGVPSLTLGLVFSGGPAPGGHDVICGILSHLRDGDALIGFCNGPGGLLRGEHKPIVKDDIELIEGVGGFDFLGTDRTKISTEAQFETVRKVIESLGVSALFVVGGDDSNTNALFLSDALFGVCNVIGVPKTIDGDLFYVPYLPITFGFHTATQHYATLVQQLSIDTVATKKYWHIVKLMGREASHVTLEVANQVCPNACVLSEEIVHNGWGLMDIIAYFSGVIVERLSKGKPYGVIVFPEGIVEVVPEFRAYIQGDSAPINDVMSGIGALPLGLKTVIEDAHGNKNMSTIDTEKIIMDGIYAYLKQHSPDVSIKILTHFFGYTGRSENPSAFDSAYALLLGKTAYELALSNVTGVIVGCDFSGEGVRPLGIPLVALVNFDEARSRYVIKKQLVSMEASEYKHYALKKREWEQQDVGFPRREPFELPNRVQMDVLNQEVL